MSELAEYKYEDKHEQALPEHEDKHELALSTHLNAHKKYQDTIKEQDLQKSKDEIARLHDISLSELTNTQHKELEDHSKNYKRALRQQANRENPALTAKHAELDVGDRKLQRDHKQKLINHIKMLGKGAEGGILKILADTTSQRGKLAMHKVLLKSDELVDIITQTLEKKMKMNGVVGIMGIQVATELVDGMLDLLPIPGLAMVGLAVQSAGNAVIGAINVVGPTSLTKMAEDSLIPIIKEFASIFQGIAGSFSCCHKDQREPKINLSTKETNELKLK
jgi:hypothetical protein